MGKLGKQHKIIPIPVTTRYKMGQLGKLNETIPIPWACTVFKLSNLILDFVGTKIEKCDMHFVTAKLASTYL